MTSEKWAIDLVNKYDDITLTNSINGNHFLSYTKDDEEVNE